MNSLVKAVLVVAACVLHVSISAQTPSTWDQVKAYSHDKKNEAVAQGKKLMAETDKQIGQLEADAKKASADTKDAYHKTVADLKVKQKEASMKLAEMEKASSNAWDATKTGFANAYKDLSDAASKASKSFKK